MHASRLAGARRLQLIRRVVPTIPLKMCRADATPHDARPVVGVVDDYACETGRPSDP